MLMRVSKSLSEQVLTVSCSFFRPKGGIAQVVHTYQKEVFEDFKFIVNSSQKGKFVNFFLLLWSFMKTACLLVFDRKIKIVHIHSASYLSFKRSALWVYLSKLFNKKVILHLHGGEFKLFYAQNKDYVKRIFLKCDQIICLSEEWQAFFELELALDNVCIIPNVVTSPQKIEQRKDTTLHLLFLGLINPQKGIFDLLDVLMEHKGLLKGRCLLHVGGNGQVQEFKAQVQAYELEDLVIYEGFVSGERKVELLNQADLYILPSYAEGLPISILEAMSYAKPILSTRVGGVPQVVQDGLNGYLFEAGDCKALSRLLLKIIDNPSNLESMGLESERLVQGYLPSSVAKALTELYKKNLEYN